ncbi:hypothetical protein BDN70DRAFT_876417 [Pholiota conissans]|uniref:Uncharacterized protein n=1 Tax=Pholiota conissans TaxID=109636 RepID=A0A9P6D3A1_9AGAR|nr:hypothetical protein BDN70DRAFT_876417 [Pholiota conissans]
MLLIYPPATVLPQKDTSEDQVQLRELGKAEDAVVSFTNLLVKTGTTSIRLHCTVPTWSSSTDTCLDLYDLHQLKSRFLLFVHDLLQSLRAAGISASYSLSPSSSSLCLICQKPVSIDIFQQLQESSDKFKREQVTLIEAESGPCLIIT